MAFSQARKGLRPFSANFSARRVLNVRQLSGEQQRRWFSKMQAPPLVYISGEEMTHYACNLMMDKWITPNIDTSKWEYYDLSCKARDDTEDKVLHDAVEAGARIGAIFKEPTITPTADQVKELGLKKAWGSPNGAMRRGWNGITISRDTIHIKGMKLGFDKPVLFERHAVGGEYGAGWKAVGSGNIETRFYPDSMNSLEDAKIVDTRKLTDEDNVVVTYHNPLDNVEALAHHFFARCLEAKVTPYVVTKKTVFKWQEGFWQKMKKVFDESYHDKYKQAGLLDSCGGQLQHLISDAATMQIIRWTGGGFGMAAHNYDGDMLTDEVAQVHRSPGFITSNLIGQKADGTMIKEYEASHGTVADLWHMHLRGEETSLNPLGLAEAMIGAIQHSAKLGMDAGTCPDAQKLIDWSSGLRDSMHACMVAGAGTRDLCGPSGLTTEQFIDAVAEHMATGKVPGVAAAPAEVSPVRTEIRDSNVDLDTVKKMFDEYDSNADGTIDLDEFARMLVKLGVAPKKGGSKNM
mmetsp:Transcript_8475/g.20403  ORF Transcript_8475/g.20403 Transcript_8475/m.20403 type:complete len:519 (+) Transcript_8475:246-1802(+)|eukprot:CAMPEP_0178999088 /NCGR_PEP_ID=MMETSP0795-20121207/9861_1 /TAXON_ID=88552 /ORGANISM="Amoebophrya sp., Strain Ameob2" /LENGTH=518 /DNA_ID=CAMNT_0020691813 /DNA_START=233 /DNA_END=1789 /DNA_ORIENTATION=+